MSNKEKINSAIGKLLDHINESLDKKEAISADTLTALKGLAQLTGYQID